MPFPVPENETNRLEALRKYKLLDTASEQSFDDFAVLASHICGTPIALMTLVDEKRQWFKAKVGMEACETPREQAFCAHTILSDKVMIVNDAQEDIRFADNPLVTAAPNIRFYAGAPLVDRNGFGLGSLCVIDNQPRTLTPQQYAALEALARQVVVQCEYRRSSEELASALAEVKRLSALLPICGHCKNIRQDDGYWQSLENYLSERSGVGFSHGICPDCVKAQYPEMYERMVASGKISES